MTKDELAQEYADSITTRFTGVNEHCYDAFRTGWDARQPEVDELKHLLAEIGKRVIPGTCDSPEAMLRILLERVALSVKVKKLEEALQWYAAGQDTVTLLTDDTSETTAPLPAGCCSFGKQRTGKRAREALRGEAK